MSQTPVRVFIYCRLSRKGGRSIERQEAEGRRIAAERGWEIAAVFKETMSASRYARGERKEWATGSRAQGVRRHHRVDGGPFQP